MEDWLHSDVSIVKSYPNVKGMSHPVCANITAFTLKNSRNWLLAIVAERMNCLVITSNYKHIGFAP
jgi:hypothetical protein